jgi:hypothetical protein
MLNQLKRTTVSIARGPVRIACTLIDDPAMLFGELRFNAFNKSGARLLSIVSDFAQSPDGHEAGCFET